MTITNKQLSVIVNQYITESGVTKSFIAKKIGVSRQAIDKILEKKNFSIDDANKILNVIGYTVDQISIKKIWKSNKKWFTNDSRYDIL